MSTLPVAPSARRRPTARALAAVLALALAVLGLGAFLSSSARAATGDYGATYVGGYDEQYTSSDESSSAKTIWVSPLGSTSDTTLAYCFNLHYAYPRTVEANNDSATSGLAYTYTKELGTSEVFAQQASTPRSGVDLSASVLKVVYNGFRLSEGAVQDAAGIQAHYGLTDTEWHNVTQQAVWYSTDNVNVNVNVNDDYSSLTANERDAVRALVGVETEDVSTATLAVVPAGQTLDLYAATGQNVSGESSTGVQNLLSTEFVPSTPTTTITSEAPSATPTADATTPAAAPSEAPRPSPPLRPRPRPRHPPRRLPPPRPRRPRLLPPTTSSSPRSTKPAPRSPAPSSSSPTPPASRSTPGPPRPARATPSPRPPAGTPSPRPPPPRA